ncbi:IS200/IS605 family transposase [Desulfonema ishimotonii]|uniref:IS200/IS605 family transposase n=1 Tax=Desulfonema ishimotonii TaxID=45657 RepID=UPI000F579AFC
MAFWRFYYHIVWCTKDRNRLITPDVEPELYKYISGKTDSLQCIPHAIGGIEDHLHLVVSIPPKISVSEFVKNVKGSSSHFLNQLKPFAWQRSFGAFTLGARQLDHAIRYVRRQKEHHRDKTTINALERIDEKSKS